MLEHERVSSSSRCSLKRMLGSAGGTKVETFNFQVTIRKHFSVTKNSLTEFRPVWVQKNEINHRGRTPA